MILPVLLEFVGALRTAGLTPGPDRVLAAAQALATLPNQPYWALRLTLCAQPSDVVVFDAVWSTRPEAGPDPAPGSGGPVVGPAESDAASVGEAADAGSDETGPGGPGAVSREQLSRRDLRDLTAAERAEIAGLIARLPPAARRRPVMRRDPRTSGRVDAARTVRLMLRNGGELSAVPRQRRARRTRRLLLFIDVSGSMSTYSDAYLRFAHAAVAAGPTTTEVFTIGNRCTRLTPLLRGRDPEAALRAVSALESDWNAGTTLGRALREFLRGWAGRNAVRGAIVVVFSDGLEARSLDDRRPDPLPRQVARLSRLGHRLLWVNPLRIRRNYRPLGALRHSLEHADEHLHGHDLASLEALTTVIAR